MSEFKYKHWFTRQFDAVVIVYRYMVKLIYIRF